MEKSAAIFRGAGKPFEVVRRPVLPPEKSMAGLTLVSSGICGTDVHIHEGCLGMPGMPLIIGHEFIGRVDALGEGARADALGSPLSVGDLAVACVAIPCGKCFNCKRGETASCLAFGVTYVKNAEESPYFHGGFAEYLFSPAANLVKLPEGVDPFAAAAFPCGGPTVIRACEYGGGLGKGEVVVIQGNGSLGLFALAWAKVHGCRVAVVGSAANPERLKLTQALEPDLFFDFRSVSEAEIVEKVNAFAVECGGGNGADVAIETSGAPSAFPFGLSLLRTRGRYFVPGQYSDRGPVSVAPHLITFRALRITGSGQYTLADLATYLRFLADHPELQKVFARLVKRYSVAEVNTAVADAERGRAVKAVFTE